jgi:hypothetical protein
MSWLLLLAFVATTQPSAQGPRTPAAASAERRALVNRIARRCHLPASAFVIGSDGSLHFRPSLHARYQDVDCGLRGIGSAGLLQDMPIVLVGNEAAH